MSRSILQVNGLFFELNRVGNVDIAEDVINVCLLSHLWSEDFRPFVEAENTIVVSIDDSDELVPLRVVQNDLVELHAVDDLFLCKNSIAVLVKHVESTISFVAHFGKLVDNLIERVPLDRSCLSEKSIIVDSRNVD
jgi:hypothetical protein